MQKRRRQAHNHPEMTPQEMARCRPASEIDRLELPIPTHLVSNEEYFPPFLQTPKQKLVEARVLDALESVPQRLNISRRHFLATSAGLAASFVALNEVFRKSAHGETLFRLAKDSGFDHHAFSADGPPSDLFVFDDQIHITRGTRVSGYAATAFLVLAQGENARFPNSGFVSNPWNPENHPDEHGDTWGNWDPKLIGQTHYDDRGLWLENFIQRCYFDSQTTVALISNVPGQIPYWFTEAFGARTPATARNVYEARPAEIITAEQNFASREFINAVAGSTRALSQGLMYMGPGNLWYLQEQIDQFGVDAWKGYQIPNAKRDEDSDAPFEYWTFDDEELAFPTFAFIRDAYRDHGSTKPGLNCVNVHKGLGEGSAFPNDIPAAAAAFPELNFVIFHSCFRPLCFNYDAWQDVQSGRLRDGVPDIKDTAEFAVLCAPYPNVYAELGNIFASCVVTFPTVCAHLMGILFKYFGADRILWGTDSTLYGSPQWQIEAFWRLQIPEAFRQRYGYPEITEEMKRKVLGLNAARLYGLSPDVTGYTKVPDDYRRRLVGDAKLMKTMEYDDFLPNELPMQDSPTSPYGVASPHRGDRLEEMKTEYSVAADRGFGAPRSNKRDGWIRVR